MPVRFACLSLSNAEAPRLIAAFATPDDRRHISSRRHPAAAVGLLARAALRALLWQTTGITAWQIETDKDGKPCLFSADERPGPAISLSHSGNAVAVTVGAVRMALGIDIERHVTRDFLAIAAYGFGPEEIAAVRADGRSAFYRIWTAREALAKATGAGIARSLGQGDGAGKGVDRGIWQYGDFHFYSERPLPDFSLTIAADVPFDPKAVIL